MLYHSWSSLNLILPWIFPWWLDMTYYLLDFTWSLLGFTSSKLTYCVWLLVPDFTLFDFFSLLTCYIMTWLDFAITWRLNPCLIWIFIDLTKRVIELTWYIYGLFILGLTLFFLISWPVTQFTCCWLNITWTLLNLTLSSLHLTSF